MLNVTQNTLNTLHLHGFKYVNRYFKINMINEISYVAENKYFTNSKKAKFQEIENVSSSTLI